MVEGQSGMVHTHDVQQSGVKIVNRESIFDGVVSIFIRFSVTEAGFDTAAGHPHRKTLGVVVTSGFGSAHLNRGGSTKFSAPQNKRIFKKTSLFQVGEQPGDRFVDLSDIDFMTFLEVGMLIPLFIVEW